MRTRLVPIDGQKTIYPHKINDTRAFRAASENQCHLFSHVIHMQYMYTRKSLGESFASSECA